MASALVMDALQRRALEKAQPGSTPDTEAPFFVADLDAIVKQHFRWIRSLPRVQPFYAVKCNPDPEILRLLSALGTGFDCASKVEIDDILSLGIHPSRIIYAHPCKAQSHLSYAASRQVESMTFDNRDELEKIKICCPNARLLLRICTDDSKSVWRLSRKFGASLTDVDHLLSFAKSIGLRIVGVAFHIGSGGSDANSFAKAVKDAGSVIKKATQIGFNIDTLDVGGGFDTDHFEVMAKTLREALEEHIGPQIRVIAEPGRYYVSSAFTLCCSVIGRRVPCSPTDDSDIHMLYINDGVYGNLSNIIFDTQHPMPKLLDRGLTIASGSSDCSDECDSIRVLNEVPRHYQVWGPTCDSIDCVTEEWLHTGDIVIGDWLYFLDMGAYTKAATTRFNGFPADHEVVYVFSGSYS